MNIKYAFGCDFMFCLCIGNTDIKQVCWNHRIHIQYNEQVITIVFGSLHLADFNQKLVCFFQSSIWTLMFLA